MVRRTGDAVGRVRAGGMIRVVVASEGPLPVRADKATYRFSLPTCKVYDLSFSLQVDEALHRNATFTPESNRVRRGEGKVVYSCRWDKAPGGGEVRFEAPLPDSTLESTSGRHGDLGPRYLVARVRPQFPAAQKGPPFAGEATETGGEAATVAGALMSGERAAAEYVRTLKA